MFDSILIANRGEIACRVIRSARRMGIRSIAVHSEADAGSLHVRSADEAHCIGPAAAAESYLAAGRILEAARRSGAQAVHPGYGFLSENADFAQACLDAGLVFIGPPPEAIRAMAEKDLAKSLMEQAGVPVTPGHWGGDQDALALRAAADRVGYPLLIKAVAGGGGRGMRAVESADAFEAARAAAAREAEAAFGDGRLLLEKLVSPARHIEVQVFADAHGQAVHLFERECSLQRRHQKIVEEAPAPRLPAALRSALGEAAVRAAKAIDYRGAGTVEFLLDAGRRDAQADFYFMEMNTRLQVEHPVTEMVTGVDLVEWQIRVAAGEPLPLAQGDLATRGHSIEARIYAEDPARGFLPSAGPILHLDQPEAGEGVRVDTGIEEGDEVSPHYDPLLAKLVVTAPSRELACGRLRDALARYRVVGVMTNLPMLARIAAHPEFVAASLDTGFIERHAGELMPPEPPLDDRVLAFACLDSLLRRTHHARAAAERSRDPHSPWNAVDGWRLNHRVGERFEFARADETAAVGAELLGGGRILLRLPGGEREVEGRSLSWRAGPRPGVEAHELALEMDGERLQGLVVSRGDSLSIFVAGALHRLELHDPQHQVASEEGSAGAIPTPMPGKVAQVLVAEGDRVRKGQTLVVIEAMKMEHSVEAPTAARVESLKVSEGAQVEDGEILVVLTND